MHRFVAASLMTFASLAALAADASAQVTERDHRTESAAPAPASSGGYYTTDRPRRYRRRPGPRFMLPLRFDIGATGASTDEGFLPGVELRLGVHWASLSPTPTNTDVGIGVFGAALAGPETDQMDDNNDVVYGGAYLEIGQTLSQGNHWRTWATGRGEYLGTDAFGKESAGFGVAGRLSAELYLSGVGIEPRGLFLGTYAIGVYAEASARGLGDAVNPIQISGGLTFRTPLVFMP